MVATEIRYQSVGRLLEISSVPSEMTRLTAIVKEPRLDLLEWAGILALELHALLRWGLSLAKQSLIDGRDVKGGGNETLCLLPNYGFALHTIRRALPFALLGQHVTVGVRPDKINEATNIISTLANEFCISCCLEVSPVDPKNLVRKFYQSKLPIFFTGSLENYRILRMDYPLAKITAATGRCGVVVCDDLKAGEFIARKRRRKIPIVSCSNHSTTIFVNGIRSDSLVKLVNGNVPVRPTILADLLRNLHPSVIFSPESELLPEELAGYSVIPCVDGIATRVEGFGRDPIGGWHGDYAIY